MSPELDPASKGREILACLAVYGKPMSFSDLAAVSRLEESRVRDAIAAVQEMFLITDEDEKDTLFRLGALTHAFIESHMEELDRFTTIKVRVENFKRSAYPESPQLARLNREIRKAEFDLRSGDLDALNDFLWKSETDRLGPEILENPRFLAMRGYAFCLGPKASLPKATDDFRASFQMGYAPPIEYVKKWFAVAKEGDIANRSTKEILDLVLNEKRYPLSDRSEMRMSRAIYLYNDARSNFFTDPTRSVSDLSDSLDEHLRAFHGLSRAKSSIAARSERFCRNTAFFLLQRSVSMDDTDKFFSRISSYVGDKDILLDPIVDPLTEYFQVEFNRSAGAADRLNRLASRAENLAKQVQKSDQFLSPTSKDTVSEQVHALRAAVKSRIQVLKERERA